MTYKRLWKFLDLRNDGTIVSRYRVSRYGQADWKVGEWKKVAGELRHCRNGFHASAHAIDALGYVQGEVLARVEVRGEAAPDSGWWRQDKSCHREMRIVGAYRFTAQDAAELAIWAAEKVIGLFGAAVPEDDRPRKAIEAAKELLAAPAEITGRDGEAFDAIMDGAFDAGRAGASDAGVAAAASAAGYALGAAINLRMKDGDEDDVWRQENARYNAQAAAACAVGAQGEEGPAREAMRTEVDHWFTARLRKLEKIATPDAEAA